MAALAAATGAQDQQPGSRPGWPCAGRPDPSYFRIAEGSGGQFFLFHPSEVGDSGALMAAAMSHGATVLRAGGQLAAGLHDFAVPVDRVDSLLFSLSVQCLQVAEIVRPSGAVLQAADPGVEYHQYEAGRIVTVLRPEPGGVAGPHFRQPPVPGDRPGEGGTVDRGAAVRARRARCRRASRGSSGSAPARTPRTCRPAW